MCIRKTIIYGQSLLAWLLYRARLNLMINDTNKKYLYLRYVIFHRYNNIWKPNYYYLFIYFLSVEYYTNNINIWQHKLIHQVPPANWRIIRRMESLSKTAINAKAAFCFSKVCLPYCILPNYSNIYIFFGVSIHFNYITFYVYI
jgi:hypothetical protein